MFYDCYFTLMSDLMQKFPLANTNLDNKVTLTLLLAISLLWLQRSTQVSFTFNVTHWVES